MPASYVIIKRGLHDWAAATGPCVAAKTTDRANLCFLSDLFLLISPTDAVMSGAQRRMKFEGQAPVTGVPTATDNNLIGRQTS